MSISALPWEDLFDELADLPAPDRDELRLRLKQLGETLTQAGAHDEAVATLERLRRMEEKLYGRVRLAPGPITNHFSAPRGGSLSKNQPAFG